MRTRQRCEQDHATYPPGAAYRVDGYRGIAWRVWGWQIEVTVTDDDEQTERTGKLHCTMIGDDRSFYFDPEDVHQLGETEYCESCGQIGCSHDGRDRSEAA